MEITRRWRFEVRLVMQTACPSKVAMLWGVVSDGAGVVSGEAVEELERELGALQRLREVARGHDLDVSLERAIIHPVDSHARDFADALLAVARHVRGHPAPVPYVRKLVVEREA